MRFAQRAFQKAVLAVAAAGICLLAGSPRSEAREFPSQQEFQAAVDRFQAYRESKRPGIKNTGNLPFLFTHGRPTDKVAFLVHGYPDSPYVMRPFGEYLHSKGFNVVSVLLKGHGTKIEDLYTVKLEDWKEDVQVGFVIAQSLGKDLLMSGFSTGGTLAIYQALKNPDQIQGMILFAPAIWITIPFYDWACDWNTPAKQLPLEKAIVLKIAKPIAALLNLMPENDPHRYAKMPVNGGCQLGRLEKEIAGHFSEIDMPVLTIASQADTLTDFKATQRFVREVRGPSELFVFPWYDWIVHPAIPSPESNPHWNRIQPLLDDFVGRYF